MVDVPSHPLLDPLTAFRRDPGHPTLGAAPIQAYAARRARERGLLTPMSLEAPRVRVIDPSVDLCGVEECPGGRDGVPWYRDAGHVSEAGARAARAQFVPVFMADP